jgi:hypothetical protein
MPTSQTLPERVRASLQGTDGYTVESPDGDVGTVEEIWLDDGGPCALAVRVEDGRHALLLAQDVVAVDREHRWVVVSENARLLELDAPRLASDDGKVTASWSTTGGQVPVARPPRRRATGSSLQRAEPAAVVERPLWQIVAMLYAALLVIVAFVIALSFTVAHLV